MTEVYEMKSTSSQSAVIENEKELSRNDVFRLILQTTIVNNSVNPDAGVKITFVYQRKSTKEQWENEVSKPLTTTKIGELRKLDSFVKTPLRGSVGALVR
ncbi:MAG: hypothetical protein Q7R39_03655, partial [Dehalococcoidia bacterium]|nr:hypothetical protein [Dehalococcoidia bacterium]